MNSFYLLIFVFCSYSCIAQESTEYEFIGTLELSNHSTISYKLTFKDIGDGKIEGFSVTDFMGGHRTKSKITGVFDHKEKKLSFEETQNVITKSDAEPENFCYVHVKDARIKMTKGKSIIQGSFKGQFPNGGSCISGYIYLIGSDFLFKKLDKRLKLLEKTKVIDSTKSANASSAKLKEQLEENFLSAGEELKVNWVSDEIILEIWDAEKVDQDKITIFVNGSTILRNYQVEKAKKIIRIPFEADTYTIRILAESEGKTPPNTTHVLLVDDTQLIPIVTNLQKGEQTTILLQRK